MAAIIPFHASEGEIIINASRGGGGPRSNEVNDDQKDLQKIKKFYDNFIDTLDMVASTIADTTNYDTLFERVIKKKDVLKKTDMVLEYSTVDINPEHSGGKYYDATTLKNDARVVKKKFDEFIVKLAAMGADSGTSPHVIFGPLKAEDRITQKAKKEYDGSYHRVIDVVRATIIFKDAVDLLRGLDRILRSCFAGKDNLASSAAPGSKDVENNCPFVVVRVKNTLGRLDKPVPGGYRDVKLSLRSTCAIGHVCELQLQIGGFYELKETTNFNLPYGPLNLPLPEDTPIVMILDEHQAMRAAPLPEVAAGEKKGSHERYEWTRKQLYPNEIRFRDAMFCDPNYVTLRLMAEEAESLELFISKLKSGDNENSYIRSLTAGFVLSALGTTVKDIKKSRILLEESRSIFRTAITSMETAEKTPKDKFLQKFTEEASQEIWKLRLRLEQVWTTMRLNEWDKAKDDLESILPEWKDLEALDENHPISLQFQLCRFETRFLRCIHEKSWLAEKAPKAVFYTKDEADIKGIIAELGKQLKEHHPRQLHARYVLSLMYYAQHTVAEYENPSPWKKLLRWLNEGVSSVFFQANVLQRIKNAESVIHRTKTNTEDVLMSKNLIITGSAMAKKKDHKKESSQQEPAAKENSSSSGSAIENAQVELESCILMQVQRLSPAHVDIRDSLNLLKEIYKAQKKYDKVVDFCTKLIGVYSEELPVHKLDKNSKYKTAWYEVYLKHLLCEEAFLDNELHVFKRIEVTTATIRSLSPLVAYYLPKDVSQPKTLLESSELGCAHELITRNLDMYLDALQHASHPSFPMGLDYGYSYPKVLDLLAGPGKNDGEGELLKQKVATKREKLGCSGKLLSYLPVHFSFHLFCCFLMGLGSYVFLEAAMDMIASSSTSSDTTNDSTTTYSSDAVTGSGSTSGSYSYYSGTPSSASSGGSVYSTSSSSTWSSTSSSDGSLSGSFYPTTPAAAAGSSYSSGEEGATDSSSTSFIYSIFTAFFVVAFCAHLYLFFFLFFRFFFIRMNENLVYKTVKDSDIREAMKWVKAPPLRLVIAK